MDIRKQKAQMGLRAKQPSCESDVSSDNVLSNLYRMEIDLMRPLSDIAALKADEVARLIAYALMYDPTISNKRYETLSDLVSYASNHVSQKLIPLFIYVTWSMTRQETAFDPDRFVKMCLDLYHANNISFPPASYVSELATLLKALRNSVLASAVVYARTRELRQSTDRLFKTTVPSIAETTLEYATRMRKVADDPRYFMCLYSSTYNIPRLTWSTEPDGIEEAMRTKLTIHQKPKEFDHTLIKKAYVPQQHVDFVGVGRTCIINGFPVTNQQFYTGISVSPSLTIPKLEEEISQYAFPHRCTYDQCLTRLPCGSRVSCFYGQYVDNGLAELYRDKLVDAHIPGPNGCGEDCMHHDLDDGIIVFPQGNVINKQVDIKVEEGARMVYNGDTTSQSASAALDVTPLDRPMYTHDPVGVKSTALINPNVDGAIGGIRLDDRTNKSVVATATNFLIGEDEMASKFFTDKTCYLNSMSLPGSGKYMGSYILSPNHELIEFMSKTVLAGDYLVPTTTQIISSMYRRWRCEMVYTFKFIAPIFSAVKVLASIHYDDFTLDVPTVGVAMANPSVVMGFDSDHREFKLRVPFYSDKEWLYNPLTALTAAGSDDVYQHLQEISYGVLHLTQLTALSNQGAEYLNIPKIQVWVNAENAQFEDMTFPDSFTFNRPEFGARTRVIKESSQPFGITVTTDGEVQESVTQGGVATPNYVPPVNLAGLADKWEQVYTFTVSPSVPNPAQWEFPHDFVTYHAEYAIKSCAYWKADLSIKVIPNTSSFVGGQAMLYFQPMDFQSTAMHRQTAAPIQLAGEDAVKRLSTLPHALIDLSSSQPVVLTIPYRHWGQAYKSSDELNVKNRTITGHVGLWITSPLQTPTVGGATVSLQILRSWSNFIPMITKAVNSSGTNDRRVARQSGAFAKTEPYSAGSVSTDPTTEGRIHDLQSFERTERSNEGASEHTNNTAETQGLQVGSSNTLHSTTTKDQTLTNTESKTDVTPIHAGVRDLVNFSPQSLVEYLRRPTLETVLKPVAGSNRYSLGMNGSLFDFSSNIPMVQIARMYGMFSGDIQGAINVSGKSKGALMFLPPYSDKAPVEIETDTTACARTVFSGNAAYLCFNYPIRYPYRTYPIWDATHVISHSPTLYVNASKNTEVEVYRNFADGARFGCFLGSPLMEFTNKSVYTTRWDGIRIAPEA